MQTTFRWKGEPDRTASRTLVLMPVGADGKIDTGAAVSIDARPGMVGQAVKTGTYAWFVAFADASGTIICNTETRLFAIGAPVIEVARSLSGTVGAFVAGRYIVVMFGSPYQGFRNEDRGDNIFSGLDAPVGFTGYEVHGGVGGDTIVVTNNQSNKIIGYGGQNTIVVNGNGNNEIIGGPERDVVVFTSIGHTVLRAGDGNDVIAGSGGSAEIYAEGGEDVIAYNGTGVVDGGDGSDVIAASGGAIVVNP